VPLPVPLAYWANSVILEFVIGMLLAYGYGCGIRIPKIAGGMLIAAAAGLLLIADHFHYFPVPTQTGEFPPRFVGWGLPAAMIVAAAVFSSSISSAGRIGRSFRLLGDSSYVIYLFHPFGLIFFQVNHVWSALTRCVALVSSSPEALAYTYTVIVLIGTATLSLPIHLFLEKPGSRALARLFIGKSQPRRTSSMEATNSEMRIVP
jgi:peptidoglycan/LPS O-acetylase OafA/YrhL